MPLAPRAMVILERFIDAAGFVLKKYRITNDSILAARLTKAVLGKHHFKVTPRSVRYQISNPYLAEKGRLPDTKEEADLWVLEGAWMVILGYVPNMPDQPGQWNGHLATFLNDRMLLDLSIVQASRSDKAMELRPILADVEPKLINGELCTRFLTDGCDVQMEVYPWHVSYHLTTSWHQNLDKLESEILRRMR